MRRVSSRRKPKSTAAHKRAAAKAQKTTGLDGVAKRGPVSGFYVVGLGASAGGLEALRSFFAAVPAKSGAAFVVVQHLAPTYRSRMVELLATHTTVPVSQIEDRVTVQPDHVYVIPPGKWVKIFHGRLFLSDPEKRAPILPIDYFFRSLAEDRGELAIGIALFANPEDYLEFLEQSPQEAAMLGRDLLINVTRFFRDGEVFDVLRGEILPTLSKRAATRKALRIWVPACATGEEAYSIAMLVQELVTARGEKWDVKIFATDVDKGSIEYAGRGLYPKSIAADVGPELLARFFVQESGALRICPEIRKQVVFARHNILRDPPFTKVDLISCRNLLIYLRADSQRRVMALFHFALRPGGYLLLGTSEAIGDRDNIFETVNAKMRIFQKRGDSSVQIESAIGGVATAAGSLDRGRESASRERVPRARNGTKEIWETISARLMAEFGTTCLVLNERYEILHSLGQPQRFPP